MEQAAGTDQEISQCEQLQDCHFKTVRCTTIKFYQMTSHACIPAMSPPGSWGSSSKYPSKYPRWFVVDLTEISWWTRGLYFRPKTTVHIFIPPPFQKWYFSPSHNMPFFKQQSGPCLPSFFPILHLFTLLHTSYFLIFLVLPFSFPFLHSSFVLPPFSLAFFIFFPPNDISWYFTPLGGPGEFSNKWTLVTLMLYAKFLMSIVTVSS